MKSHSNATAIATALILAMILQLLSVSSAFFVTPTTRTTTSTTPIETTSKSLSCPTFLSVASVPEDQESTLQVSSSSPMLGDNFGKGNGLLKQALKKMRGSSVSISYAKDTSTSASESISSMDLEILSQELRKSAKVSSIFTNDLYALQQFSNEQKLAAGNFPGPCPIIYYNPGVNALESTSIQSVIENGASGIVLDVSSIKSLSDNQNNNSNNNLLDDTDIEIICDVQSVDDIKEAVSIGYNYIFLISATSNHQYNDKEEKGEDDKDNDDNSQIKEMLSAVPSNAVVLCSLEAMQPNSHEITRGKEALSVSVSSPTAGDTSVNSSSTSTSSSNKSGSFSSSLQAPPPLPTTTSLAASKKVHGLLIENACVGDDEDVKYTCFAVNSITKKSSSTFAMTGLTGSTNGHFGTMSDNASIENAKWKRVTGQE